VEQAAKVQGAKNDPGDDDDKMSGGELAARLFLGAGAVAGRFRRG